MRDKATEATKPLKNMIFSGFLNFSICKYLKTQFPRSNYYVGEFQMEYDELLNKAYDEVKPVECSDRFEIKKVEGHHEGTKTVISNFQQITKCLRRKSPHLVKFLFKELATSGWIDKDRLILDRKVPSSKINDKIEEYSKKYVICPKCKKPDTELVEEAGKSFLRCLACGNKKQVS